LEAIGSAVAGDPMDLQKKWKDMFVHRNLYLPPLGMYENWGATRLANIRPSVISSDFFNRKIQ